MTSIENYLSQFNDFDIRQTHDARYVDQKCTPDIVCFIADCILNTSCATKTFTINDLWDERFFIDNCRVIFGKPSPADPSARNEYNMLQTWKCLNTFPLKSEMHTTLCSSSSEKSYLIAA